MKHFLPGRVNETPEDQERAMKWLLDLRKSGKLKTPYRTGIFTNHAGHSYLYAEDDLKEAPGEYSGRSTAPELGRRGESLAEDDLNVEIREHLITVPESLKSPEPNSEAEPIETAMRNPTQLTTPPTSPRTGDSPLVIDARGHGLRGLTNILQAAGVEGPLKFGKPVRPQDKIRQLAAESAGERSRRPPTGLNPVRVDAGSEATSLEKNHRGVVAINQNRPAPIPPTESETSSFVDRPFVAVKFNALDSKSEPARQTQGEALHFRSAAGLRATARHKNGIMLTTTGKRRDLDKPIAAGSDTWGEALRHYWKSAKTAALAVVLIIACSILAAHLGSIVRGEVSLNPVDNFNAAVVRAKRPGWGIDEVIWSISVDLVFFGALFWGLLLLQKALLPRRSAWGRAALSTWLLATAVYLFAPATAFLNVVSHQLDSLGGKLWLLAWVALSVSVGLALLGRWAHERDSRRKSSVEGHSLHRRGGHES